MTQDNQELQQSFTVDQTTVASDLALQQTGQELEPAAVTKRSPWGVWWLTVITFSVYYFVWYHKVNGELAERLGIERGAKCAWWSQLIPVFAWVGLSQTAKRVNAANIAAKSSARVSPFVTWFWATWWFASQTRYLQRRVNILHDM